MSDPTPKAAARERSLRARQGMSLEERAERSRLIAERVLGLDAFRRAGTVAVYASMGAEADPSSIAGAALAAGRRVVFPRVQDGRRLLAFAACAPGDLVPGPHRTREPPAGAPSVPLSEIDVLLVPGVAFDERCRRLGRGGGYYDATLAALGPAALSVGLAFEVQMVPELPCDAHDRPVDALVTEVRVRFRLPRGLPPGNSPGR